MTQSSQHWAGHKGASKNMSEKVRLSLDVSSELDSTLKKLAHDIGGTKSDVLRKAITLMEVAMEGKQRGHRLGLADKDRKFVTEIIGL